MHFYIKPTSKKPHKYSFCSNNCTMSDGILQCNCGEDIDIFNWCWSKANSSSNIGMSADNREILFNPFYSSGTAAVRGNMPFQPNLHYYWEVKMISKLYGTDVMVGVGTSDMMFSEWNNIYCSMLGINSHSWGYSYQGKVQHCGMTKKYGKRFGLGSVVGVHLDMCSGTLEYYLNRQPLGIAFTNLKGKELYPMVSSTASQLAVRINCAVSEEPTLQMKCLELISKHPQLYNVYKDIPGLRRAYDKKYFWIVPRIKEDKEKRLAMLEDKLMNPLKRNRPLKGNKKLPSAPLQYVPQEFLYVCELVGQDVEVSLDSETSSDEDVGPVEVNAADSPICPCPCCKNPSRSNHNLSVYKRFGRTPSFKGHFDNRNICAKCKFRMELENDDFSDSSGS